MQESNGPPTKKLRTEEGQAPTTVQENIIDESDFDAGYSSDIDAADLEYSNGDGTTPLHFAAKIADVKTIQQLLAQGAMVDARDQFNVTPLMVAVRFKKLASVHALLEGGANELLENAGLCVYQLAAYYGFTAYLLECIHNKAGFDVDFEHSTLLRFAAFRGHVGLINALLSLGAKLEAVDEDGGTPFFTAAEGGYVRAMKAMECKGANIHATNRFGENALQYSSGCHRNRRAVTEYFVKKGFDLNQKILDTKGNTSLHIAARYDSSASISALHLRGANIEALNNDGLTPLLLAVRSNAPCALRCLIAHGANQMATTRGGLTAVHIAARFQGNSSEIMTILLNHTTLSVDQWDRSENKRYKPPMLVAAAAANLSAMGTLGAFGASASRQIYRSYFDEICPVDYLATRGNIEALDILLSQGASISDDGDSAVHKATYANQLDTVDFLLTNGATINQRDSFGYMPLHWAAANGTVHTISYLIKNGADLNAADEEGSTPLMFAIRNYNEVGIELLLSCGANINAQGTDGKTPMHVAAAYGHVRMIQELSLRGASIDDLTISGMTPLRIAARHGEFEAVQALIDLGASVAVTSQKGQTPLHELFTPLCFELYVPPGELYPEPTIPYSRIPDDLDGNVKRIVQKLLDSGVELNVPNIGNRQTEFHVMANITEGVLEEKTRIFIAKSLAAEGVDTESMDKDGLTPLLRAAKNASSLSINVLLRAGASPAAVTREGYTALHECVRRAMYVHSSQACIQLLLRYKADVNVTNVFGVTPLHLAAAAGNRAAVIRLVENGADPLRETVTGLLPAHWAIGHARVSTLAALLSLGGDSPTLTQHFDEEYPECSEALYRKIENTVAAFARRAEDPQGWADALRLSTE